MCPTPARSLLRTTRLEGWAGGRGRGWIGEWEEVRLSGVDGVTRIYMPVDGHRRVAMMWEFYANCHVYVCRSDTHGLYL